MKFTAIWQSKAPKERPWIEEIFGDLIAEHVFDGNHEVVLDDAILLDSFIATSSARLLSKVRGKECLSRAFSRRNLRRGIRTIRSFSRRHEKFGVDRVQSKEGAHLSVRILEPREAAVHEFQACVETKIPVVVRRRAAQEQPA